MFEQTFKNIDDLEKDKQTAAELSEKPYERIIDQKYQWAIWAAPKLQKTKKTSNGKVIELVEIDHNALTGDDLLDFVNNELFPYLKKFKINATSANTIEYKIGEILAN